MALIPQTRQGGTKSWQAGSLKRRLPSISFANLGFGAATGIKTSTLKLTGLNGALNVQIAAGFVTVDGQSFKPSQVQAGGVTMQLTPVTNFGDAGRMMLRPVFQDPTLPVNTNNPLPQDLPFGWEFSTEADEVWIDLTINTDWSGLGTGISGTAMVQVTIEYNGEWLDHGAAEFMIGQVNLTDASAPVFIATAPT